MRFDDFIAKYPKCSIQAYEIAKAAWEEQQKTIDAIISAYEGEFWNDSLPDWED